MYVFAVSVLIIAIVLVLWQRRRTRKTMEHLHAMLDAAISGGFREDAYDETMLSSVESRLRQYLALSAISAQNQQAEKESIQALVADISHQTRTPISNILLYTQLLEEQDLPEKSKNCVRALSKQAEKLQVLIAALVKTSRLESGIIQFHPVKEALEPMVDSATAQVLPLARKKQIRLIRESAAGEAVFDRKWTEEALYNLLDNAVKYTPAGGEIRVRVLPYPMFSAIEVRDTGPGIPEKEQPMVFQRFYRGQAHQIEEGVGIGLYLARQIAEGQVGYMKLSSRPGMGSIFSLYLPNA